MSQADEEGVEDTERRGGAMGLGESDSEDELPAGWEERTTQDGLVFYANHAGKSTQWGHPRTGKKKRLVGRLPPGWRRQTDPNTNKPLFVNCSSGRQSWTDPRLAFAVEEGSVGVGGVVGMPRQRFDAASTAMQVLHGRDLSASTALITGANSGIGFETARCLALHNAHVLMVCRDVAAAQRARSLILQQKPTAKVDVVHCDLASLHSVRQCANTIIAEKWSIDMLILNAGVMLEWLEKSTDGLERTAATNHFGHFYLLKLLLPVVRRAGRVVVVACESHRHLLQPLTAQSLTLQRLSPHSQKDYWYMDAYALSKLCNVLFAFEMNKRLFAEGITVNAVHPGNMVYTGLSRHSSCWLRWLWAMGRPWTKTAAAAAATAVWAATATELSSIGGVYLNNCCFCRPSAAATDALLQRRLFDLSDALINDFENGTPLAI